MIGSSLCESVYCSLDIVVSNNTFAYTFCIGLLQSNDRINTQINLLFWHELKKDASIF